MKDCGPADDGKQAMQTGRWKPDASTVYKAVSGLRELTLSSNSTLRSDDAGEISSRASIPQQGVVNQVHTPVMINHSRPTTHRGSTLSYTASNNTIMDLPNVPPPSIVTGQSRRLIIPRPADNRIVSTSLQNSPETVSNGVQNSVRFSNNGAFRTIHSSQRKSAEAQAFNHGYSLKSSTSSGILSPALQLQEKEKKNGNPLQPPPAHMGSRLLSEKLWCHNRRSTFTTGKRSERPGYWRQAHVYIARTIQEMQQRRGLCTYKSVKKYYGGLSSNDLNGENLTTSYKAQNSTQSKTTTDSGTQPTVLTIFHSTAAMCAPPTQHNGTQSTTTSPLVKTRPASYQTVAMTTNSPVMTSTTQCTTNWSKNSPVAKTRMTNPMQQTVMQSRKRPMMGTDPLPMSMQKKQKEMTPVYYSEAPHPYTCAEKLPFRQFPVPEQSSNILNIEKALAAEHRAYQTSLKMHYKVTQPRTAYTVVPEKWLNQSAMPQPMRYYPMIATDARTANLPYQNSTYAMQAASQYPYAEFSRIPSNSHYYYTPPSY